MAAKGDHQARLTVKGDTRSGDKEMAKLADRVNKFETRVESTNEKLGKFTQKLKKKGEAAKEASGFTGELTKKFKDMVNPVTIATGVITGAGAAIAAMTAEAVRNTREIDNWSRVLGMSSREVQQLSGVARAAGVEVDGVRDAVQTFRENLGEMQRVGTGPAVDSLKTLGIELNEIINLPADEQLKLVAERMKGLANNSEGLSVVLESMGDEGGRKLLPLLRQGAAGIEHWGRVAEETGFIMDESMLAKMRAVDEQTRTLTLQWEAFRNELASEVVPALGSVLDTFTDLETMIGDLTSSVDDGTEAAEENGAGWHAWLMAFPPVMVSVEASVGLWGLFSDAVQDNTRVIMESQRQIEIAMEKLDAAVQQRARTARDLLAEQGRLQAEAAGLVSSSFLTELQPVDVQDTTKGPGPKKKKGGKRDRFKAERSEFQDQLRAAHNAETAELAAQGMRRDRFHAEHEQRLKDHTDRLRQIREQEIVDFQAYQVAKANIEMEQELFRIESEFAGEEMTLDQELVQIQMVRDAKLEALEVERDAVEATMDGRERELELARISHQERMLYAQAEIDQTEAKKQAHLKYWATVSQVTAATNQILQGGAQTGAMAADLFIEGEKRKEKAKYAFGATMAFITGVTEQVQAIAAFASFNYVQGALHQAAAIFAFAQGGMLAAKAGQVGGGGSKASVGGGGGLGLGGGPTAGAGGPAANEPPSTQDTPIPVSPGTAAPAANEDPSRNDVPRRTERRGDFHVHVHSAVIDRQTVREITKEQQHLQLAEGGL